MLLPKFSFIGQDMSSNWFPSVSSATDTKNVHEQSLAEFFRM